MSSLPDKWPPAVCVRGGFHGCDTGCEVVEFWTPDEPDEWWIFGSLSDYTDADLRDAADIPADVIILRGETLDEQIARVSRQTPA